MSKYDQIYIVDDDPIIRMVHKKLLENLGEISPIRTFSNGKEALLKLTSLEKQPLNILVLLDINMPVMNAWEFLDAFERSRTKSSLPHVSVTIVTSSIDKQDKRRAFVYSSVKGYLEKPLTVTSLQSIL